MSEPKDDFDRIEESEDLLERAQNTSTGLGSAFLPDQASVTPVMPQAPKEETSEKVPESQVETPKQPPETPVAATPDEAMAAPDPEVKEPKDEKPDDSPSVAGEIGMAFFRGPEAAAEGIYGILDAIDDAAFNVLPKWDRAQNSAFGTSQTTVGKMAESVVQFGVGMIPGVGVMAGISKVGGALGKVSGATRAARISRVAMKTFAKKQLSLSPTAMRQLSRLKAGTKTQVKWATTGFFGEFLAFKGEEERLSNMLSGPENEHTNAFINYLTYRPDDDVGEAHERFKRALEGAVVGEVLGGAFVVSKAALSGLGKTFGKFKKKNEIVGKRLEEGEDPDEFDAWKRATGDPDLKLTADEENAIRDLDKQRSDAEQVELEKNLEATEPPPEIVQQAEEAAGAKAKGKNDLGGDKSPREAEAAGYRDIDPDTADIKDVDAWFLEHGEMSVARMPDEAKRGALKDILEQSKPGGTEDVLKQLGEAVVKRVEEAGLLDPTNPKSLLRGLKMMGSVTEMRALLGSVVRTRALAAKKAAASGEGGGEWKRTNELLQRGIEAAGGRARDVNIDSLRARPADLARIEVEADVLYDGLSLGASDLHDKVMRAREAMEKSSVLVKVDGKDQTFNLDEALTEVYSAMDRFTGLQEIWNDFGSQMSLLFRQRNDLYKTGQSSLGRDIPGQHRGLGMAVEDALTESGKRFRRENSRGVSGKRVIKDLEKLFKKSGVGKAGGDMKQLTEGLGDVGVNRALSRYMLVGRKGLAVSQEWYYNAILGSPTSWVVNLMGGMLVQPLRHMESIAGGVASGNTDLVKANFRVMFDLQSFGDSLKYAWKSGVDDEARSISGYTAFRDDRLHTPKGEIHINNPKHFEDGSGNALYSGINFLGHVIRHPSRIMMMGDEFFKQMSFRARIKTSLAMDGYAKGLHRDPGKLAEYIHDGFEATITKDGRFRNEDNVRREALMALVEAKKMGDSAAMKDERTFIKNHMDAHFYNHELKLENGTIYSAKGFDEREMLVEAGTNWALMNTFTNDVTNGFFKKTGEIAQMSPWLGFVIPFVRTPSNILMFALGRTLPTGAPKEIIEAFKKTKATTELLADDKAMGELASKIQAKKHGGGGGDNTMMEMPEAERLARSYLKMMETESSIQAAESIGRLSTGLMTMGTVFLNLENILDRVTGTPPEDPGKRAAWAATGKMPFSIQFGDKWYSYQRLDPLATTIGIMADISHGWADMRKEGVSEFGDEDEFEEKQAYFARVCGVLATSFANNVSNKSYIENLGELLDILEKPSEAIQGITGNVFAGFVPNGMNWSQNVFEEEPAILEARSIMDKIRKRLPEGVRKGKKIMPRRNAYGEVMRKSKNTTGDIRQNPLDIVKGLNPIFSSNVSNDIVDMETEHQSVGRQPMSDGRNIRGKRISYKSYRNELGDTAYDRMQELSGTMKLGPRQLTLRQAMRETIESPDYQNLPPITEKNRHRDHPRSKALTRILNIYRAASRQKTVSEFSQLRADLSKLLQ